MGRGSVLLLHGFPGTPAEMRPIARALHQAGWTVQGPLLPGFGAEIAHLHRYRYREWIEAVGGAHRELVARGEPVVVFGYSMGAALALAEAARQPPAALVLAAPFHRMGSRAQNFLWPVLSLLVRRFRPFEGADFSNPEIRTQLAVSFPGADLEDPAVVENLRRISIPFSVLSDLRGAGRQAWRQAPRVEVPTLILQGREDQVVSPRHTHHLAARLGGPVEEVEVPGGHELLDPRKGAWPEVERTILDFLSRTVQVSAPSSVPRR